MKNRKPLILLAFSLALNVSFVSVWTYHYFFVRPALAQAAPESPKTVERTDVDDPAGPSWQRLAGLNLTQEQQASFKAEHIALRRKIEESRGRTQAAREAIYDLLAQPDGDPAALQAAYKELGRHEGETRRMVFEHLVRMKKQLNNQLNR